MTHFSARETEWLLELDGIELAGFPRRAVAFILDSALSSLVIGVFGGFSGLRHWGTTVLVGHSLAPTVGHYTGAAAHPHHFVRDIVIPILYFGLFTWWGRGRSPGKFLMKIRVVSLMHRHLSLWHALERALGYGAAALEFGFGFLQFFLHPYRRCVQDRIAETIVVTEAGYTAMQHKRSHPLIPDGAEV